MQPLLQRVTLLLRLAQAAVHVEIKQCGGRENEGESLRNAEENVEPAHPSLGIDNQIGYHDPHAAQCNVESGNAARRSFAAHGCALLSISRQIALSNLTRNNSSAWSRQLSDNTTYRTFSFTKWSIEGDFNEITARSPTDPNDPESSRYQINHVTAEQYRSDHHHEC
jgi:hypothetical protein